MQPHKSKLKNLVAIVVMLVALIAVGKNSHQESQSASLSNVSVTLSNSRPSFRGKLAAGNSAGSSQVIINTTAGANPSTSSAQLQTGDSVDIGDSSGLGTYVVTGTVPDSSFTVDPVLGGSHADAGDDVIATQSATLTIRLKTKNAVEDGKIRVLVPADTSDNAAKDGIPDSGAFDYGATGPSSITCPTGVGGYTFGAGTSSPSAVTINGQKYHSYVCPYTGAGAIGTDFSGSGKMMIVNSVINPAPKTSHSIGTADSYKVIVQHLDSSNNVVDLTTTAIGVIEAVKVTASVAPQISFKIIGVPSSTSACGVNTNVATTPVSVPFGELSIDSFTNAAQTLSVSTNATNGYVVTALANDQLGKDGGTCTGDAGEPDCIPDSTGDNNNMSHSASDKWDSTGTKGFGFSLHDNNTSGLTPAFQYSDVAGNCSGGSYCARQFADHEDGQNPQQIFSHNSVADNQNLMVCYRAVISATQSAGDYENHITYTATATF